jgi:hypothetical protein
MKTIIYECGLPNTLSGGFGDRIIGIISCMALAEFLGTEFFISWNDTPLLDYFDFPALQSSCCTGTIQFFRSHLLDELKIAFDRKSPADIHDKFVCDHLKINTNQNLWQYLSVDEPYEQYTSRLFAKLFKTILIPRPNLLQIVDQYTASVGVQLRFGDIAMNMERQQINSPQHNHFPLGRNITDVLNLLHEIAKHHTNEKIFVTSDINIEQFINLSAYPNIVMYKKPSVHIERSVNKDGLDKCFVDFLALCRCKTLYITAESNFGRCPGIISGADVFKIGPTLDVTRCGVKYMACKNT